MAAFRRINCGSNEVSVTGFDDILNGDPAILVDQHLQCDKTLNPCRPKVLWVGRCNSPGASRRTVKVADLENVQVGSSVCYTEAFE